MTKTMVKEMFAIAMEMVQLADVKQEEMAAVVAFLQEQADKVDVTSSSGKKLTKAQQENEEIKGQLAQYLEFENEMCSISHIQGEALFSGYSNQKLSALLNQMVKDGIIAKGIDTSRKTTFGIEKPKTKNEKPKTENVVAPSPQAPEPSAETPVEETYIEMWARLLEERDAEVA